MNFLKKFDRGSNALKDIISRRMACQKQATEIQENMPSLPKLNLRNITLVIDQDGDINITPTRDNPHIGSDEAPSFVEWINKWYGK